MVFPELGSGTDRDSILRRCAGSTRGIISERRSRADFRPGLPIRRTCHINGKNHCCLQNFFRKTHTITPFFKVTS